MINIRKLFEPTDMTVGTPWKSIALFSVPMLIGNIAQQLYSTVDSIVVGHYVGDNALASVGSAAPLFNMLLVLFVGISAGVGIMVSQYFGAKAREELSHTIGTCITMTALVSLVLMIAAPPFIRSMLSALNTPASILDDCTAYLKILMYGIAGMAYYNILSGILRGMGDSFSALIYLLIATVLNIFLDVYFVAGLNMGFAQLKMTKRHTGQIIKLGIPSGLTQAIMSSAMIVVQSLTNSFGEMFIAANVIVMRVDGFAMMPNLSFGTAMTTYAGQNVGAKKHDRVIQGAKQGTALAVGCSIAITLIILLFGKYLMMIFTDTAELVDLSVRVMRILAAGYIAVAVTQSLSGVMRGAGDTVTPMVISLITTIVIRVPVAYGLSYLTRTPDLPVGRFESIPVSLLICWLMGAVLTTIFYKVGRWKKTSLQ